MRKWVASLTMVAATLALAGCGEKTLAEKCDDESAAYVAGMFAIKGQLRSPSEADFPSSLRAKMVRESECKWSMVSYVDAKNGFNATTRVPWIAVVEFDEITDEWSVLSASLIE